MVENPNIQETKITIECNRTDSQILKIISLINNYENNDKKIVGISKGETYCIEQDNNSILFFNEYGGIHSNRIVQYYLKFILE